MAYHAGVLRALEVETGFVPNRADLIVGTSAGSVIGSYLRTGWPEAWPSEALWWCTVDIVRGRRVVLGRKGAPAVSLPRAVQASCAIPGVYEPIKVGRMTLVDGGARSTTNLDLATKAECDVIIGV